MTDREPLPNRRDVSSNKVMHSHSGGPRAYEVSYGFRTDGTVREVFCWPQKSGADIDALVSDACIITSRLLQRGEKIRDLAGALGQLRPEGWKEGDPEGPCASPLGTIVRVGALIEEAERIRRRPFILEPQEAKP